jgi:hypothetical protein
VKYLYRLFDEKINEYFEGLNLNEQIIEEDLKEEVLNTLAE